MADDIVRPQAAAAALPEHVDVLNALQDIQGAVRLSRQAVYNTMNEVTLRDDPAESAATLSSADGVLTLTEAAIERLYLQLDAMRNAWPTPVEAVGHG
jgi:hypothetical protein